MLAEPHLLRLPFSSMLSSHRSPSPSTFAGDFFHNFWLILPCSLRICRVFIFIAWQWYTYRPEPLNDQASMLAVLVTGPILVLTRFVTSIDYRYITVF